MKPKYIFYLFMIVVIHYEVGRIVSVTTTQPADDEQPSSQKGVKLDENKNQPIAPVYVQRVHFIKVNNHYRRHKKVLTTAYKNG